MKDRELDITLCDICQDVIIGEKDDALHYPRNDYHVSCFIQRLRQKGALPPAQWTGKEAVV